MNTAPVAHLKDYKAKSRREEILLHIEFPGYSALATAYAIFDLMIIIISTIILVLESVDELKRYHLFEKVAYLIDDGLTFSLNFYVISHVRWAMLFRRVVQTFFSDMLFRHVVHLLNNMAEHCSVNNMA